MADRSQLSTSIRSRLALLTAGLLVPGLLIGALLLWDSYRHSRAATERQLIETATALSLVVDRQIGEAATFNRVLATSPFLKTGDLKAFEQQAREALSDRHAWVTLMDARGQLLVNTRFPPGADLPHVSLSARPWTEMTNGASISNMMSSQLTGEEIITVNTPVDVGSNRYLLSYVMRPSMFSSMLEQQSLPPGWVGNIIDGDNNVVARSFRSEEVRGSKVSGPMLSALAEADRGVVESFSFEGVPTLVAFSRSPVYRWTFGVSVPRELLQNTITGNLALAAGGGLALLVLGALLSRWVSRSISRPVEGLAQSALALGQGKIVDPPRTRIKEVNAVGQALRDAYQALQSRGAELIESETRLRLAVQATRLGIWDYDLSSGQHAFSRELFDVFGIAPTDQVGIRTFLRQISERDRAAVFAQYRAFVETGNGGAHDLEFRIRRSERAGEAWVHASLKGAFDEESRLLQLSGTVLDVTERRTAEEVQRESEERFRAMADNAPALIWMTDPAGNVTFANAYHERMFGRPAADLYAQGWVDIVGADGNPFERPDVAAAISRHESLRFEMKVRDGSGNARWLRCEAVPRFSGPDGEFVGYVGCNIDVTEAKMTADLLERRIDERTVELASANKLLLTQIEERERVEATLRQVQRLEAVGQLTSGVAHDFNNLLTVVLGNVALAERHAAEGPLARRLANIRMAAERGASLVAQLLAFSRRQRLEPKIINLNETVVGMRELLQSSMGGSVAVEIALQDNLWPALVDPTQIELIILNLAINARDAMEVGGLLRVSTSNEVIREQPVRPEQPSPGEYVVVAVSDSGTGMSEDVMARVFEPFFTTKEVGKGSGLGLSQVLGFAKQSGGGVRIASREGRGTIVQVFLPRANAAPTEIPQPRSEGTPPRDEAHCILVVDDDDLVREVTSSKLQALGYNVVEAANGPSALVALEENPLIELLVLDFAMPGMNGAEVARAAEKRRPGIPMMFVTGYADLSALEEVSGVPILHKPFRDEELAQQVESLLHDAPGSNSQSDGDVTA
ncbi:PAS domain S-box protein [Terrihabitans sp. B22-R8]|uniref:PAS domain S-box protein n=1 Tax=Terrihabitans sp. B22-R8 TaxID=3425128 RepID=UPI00403C81A2